MDKQLPPLQRAKLPRTALAGPYGHPFHPILVTIPIGAWLSSFIFDLFAIFSDDHSPFLQGTQLLIAIGVIAAVLAAIFGLLDLSTVESGTPAKKTGLTHMVINLIVIALFVTSFTVQAVAGYDDVSITAFTIIIVALALLMVSGWLGGKLAYHYGIRVTAEETQAQGFRFAG